MLCGCTVRNAYSREGISVEEKSVKNAGCHGATWLADRRSSICRNVDSKEKEDFLEQQKGEKNFKTF